MTGLLDAVLDAHGGLDRWQRSSTIEATIVSGGSSGRSRANGRTPARVLADPVGR
jgi:hypothetical protein